MQLAAQVPELKDYVSELAFPPEKFPPDVLLLRPVGVHFARNERQYQLTRIDGPQPGQLEQLTGPQYIRADSSTFVAMVEILRYLHDAGIVHRDVRMDNFFWNPLTNKVFFQKHDSML